MTIVAAAVPLVFMMLAVVQIVIGIAALIRHEDGRQIFMAVTVAGGGFALFFRSADAFARLMLA